MTQSPEEAARPSGIPTAPAELAAWKEQFTDDLVARPYDEWSEIPVHDGVRREG